MSKSLHLVVLAREGESTSILIRALESRHTIVRVVVEEKESRWLFLKRRAKRSGILTVIGQVLFMALVPPVLSVLSRARVRELLKLYALDASPLTVPVTRVSSVNSNDVIRILKQEQPDAVVVHGTRIIANNVLTSMSVPFYNIHAGITPLYRGVHGGYWALADGHPELFGSTVHRVDAGVDTGSPVAYAYVHPSAHDTFVTYPLLQLGEGIRALLTVLGGDGEHPVVPEGVSKVWYHPTLWGYLATYIRRGVR